MKKQKNKIPERIPRPQGITMMMKEYKHNPTDHVSKLRIIQTIITQGFMINHKPISLAQIASMLNIKINTVLTEIFRGFKSMELNNEAVKSGEILKMAIFGALENIHRGTSQYEILAFSQAGTYKPYITSETNKALLGSIAANTALVNIAGFLIKAEELGLKRQVVEAEISLRSEASDNPSDGTQYLSINEALTLLQPHILPPTQLGLTLTAPEGPNIVANQEGNLGLYKKPNSNLNLSPTEASNKQDYEYAKVEDEVSQKVRLNHIARNEPDDLHIHSEEDLE